MSEAAPSSARFRAPIPRPALMLGYGGLLPFAMGAAGVWFGGEYALAAMTGQAVYAAVILSFLGGVQWGFALAALGQGAGPNWERLGWSVLPCLFGWAAFFLPPFERTTALILALLAVYVIDRNWALRFGRGPEWYVRLRRHLTAGAVLCLGLVMLRLGMG